MVVIGGALLAPKQPALGAVKVDLLEVVRAEDRFEVHFNSTDGFGEGSLGVLNVLLFCIFKLLQSRVELVLDFLLRVLGLLELLSGSNLLALNLLVSLVEHPFELFILVFEELNLCKFGIAKLWLLFIFLLELVFCCFEIGLNLVELLSELLNLLTNVILVVVRLRELAEVGLDLSPYIRNLLK